MPCYSPLLALRVNGCVRVMSRMDGYAHGLHAGDRRVDPVTGEVNEVISIPCGQCIGCRLDHSRQWADRCLMETLDHDPESCWFVTLTYDDDHVPVSPETGCLTLDPPALSGWIKRLRRAAQYHHGIDDGIRFYACGEYGGRTGRPHYHALIYGLSVPSGEPVARNRFGDSFYSLPIVTDTWGEGLTTVGRITWQSAAYTARYCLKKWKGGNDDDYRACGIANEFVRMSRRPGIAGNYLCEHLDDIYVGDRIVLPSDHGRERVCRPPRYADKLLGDVDPVRLAQIKARRSECAEQMRLLREQYTDLDEDEYLDLLKCSAERTLEKKLPRPDF